MPIYGGYETITELHRGALGAVWSARRAGAAEEAAFAVRTCQPDGAILGEARAAAAIEDFLARAAIQQRAAQAAPLAESRWAQVYEIGRIPASPTEPAGVFIVTDLATRGTIERMAAGRTQIDSRTLASIVDGVVTGLRQINSPAGGGRAHGRLEPGNVLLLSGTPGQPPSSGRGGSAKSAVIRVALADPAAVMPPDKAQAALEDQQALGKLIHLLVLHEPFRGQLPLEPASPWQRLGKSGDPWRQLTERLLERSSPVLSHDDLAGQVKALRRMRRSRAPLIVGVAAVALLAGGVGAYLFAEKARQRQAAPLPETLWNPDAAARWAQLCDAYRTWYGSFLTRLEQRPPTASTQHRTRRAWYSALDKELGPILEPHALLPGKGTDPWTLAGVDAGADLTTLSASPSPRARSDASVQRTRQALESIERLLSELPQRWPAIARLRELAGIWDSRGWKEQAAFVRHIADAAAPSDPASVDLAAAFDDLLRTRPMVERVESRWSVLKLAGEAIAANEDPVLKGTTAALNAMVVAAPSADTAPGASTPTREDVTSLERNIDAAADLAARLQTFLAQEWTGIDVDSFHSGERYQQLVAAPANAESLEGWLFEVRGHARLDPALDPRAAWDEPTLLQPVNTAVAELATPLLNSPVDPATAQRIESLAAATRDLAPGRLPWNRRNRDRIESESLRIRRDIASIQAELEGRIATRMQELATTAEEVRDQLRARATITPESPALNSAWAAGRDRLLAEHTGIDFEALKRAAKNLEGELTWAAAAFGAASPADDLDGRIRRPPAAKGAAWALRVAQTVGALRERSLADALTAAGNPEQQAFRSRFEPLARAYRAGIDELAAQVTALEAVQSRLDAADPLSDDGAGTGRLVRAQQAADQLAARSPAISEALAELRERLDTLAQINRESASSTLVARIRDARPDRPEAAMAAFRRLASPEVDWPATPDDLKDGAPVRDALLRVAASVPEPSRRDELSSQVRTELAARWTALAQRAGDPSTFEPVALAASDFAVRTATLPPALRFNLALTQVRRALARPGIQEDTVRQLVAAFLTEVRTLPPLPAASTERLTQVNGLIDGSQPEPPSIDPLTLGPGAVGWRGEADAAGRLTFTSGASRLEFVRLEVQRTTGGGEVVPVYFGVSEVSVGNFARIVAQARAQDQLHQVLQIFDPGTNTWAGPRSWTWNASRAVAPNQLWLKLDANVNSQRPAYPASILRPDNFRLLRDEAGGEPNTEHPIQQISPGAAALVARLAGCRLPATDEWRAARQLLPASELAEWNLRDATFNAQKNHIRAMQGQVVNKASFPWPDANILLPEQPKVPVEDRATAHDFDDGILWFAPCTSDARHPVQHLIGNVAELVFDQPDRMDAAKPTADSIQSLLQQSGDALAAIGGSSLSPPELSPGTRIPVDLLFSTEGFADVGFRMAFTARGTRPPRETLASKVLRILSADSYIFARR